MSLRFDHDDGVSAPKQARSRETVRSILRAARQVANRPDEEPTVSRIAEISGVAPGSIYRFFRSKDQIFAELAIDMLDEVQAHLHELLVAHADDDNATKTRVVVASLCERFERNQRLFAVLREVTSRVDVDARLARARMRIIMVVARSLAHHFGLPAHTAEQRAYVMVMACSGVLVGHRSEHRDLVTAQALQEELEQLFGRYVGTA